MSATIKLRRLVSSRKGKKPSVFSDVPKDGLSPYILIEQMEWSPVKLYADKDCPIAGKNDILIVWDGSIGKTATWIEWAIWSTIVALTPIEAVNRDYLHYFLQFSNPTIKANPKGSWLGHINPEIFWNLDVPIYNKEQQRKIVDELDKQLSRLEYGQTLLTRIRGSLNKYRASVLNDAVVWKLSKSSEIKRKGDELPVWWETYRLEEISDAIWGNAFESSKFTKIWIHQVIKMGNVRMWRFLLDSSPAFYPADNKLIEKFGLRKDDVVITLTWTKGKRDYGYVVRVKDEQNLLLNQRLARLRFHQANSAFYEYYLQSENFRNRFFSYETWNVGQWNVSMKAITRELVPVPPISEQDRIVREIEQRFEISTKIAEAINANLKRIENLRHSLLRKAFSWELVPNDSDDKEIEALIREIESIESTPKKGKKIKTQ